MPPPGLTPIIWLRPTQKGPLGAKNNMSLLYLVTNKDRTNVSKFEHSFIYMHIRMLGCHFKPFITE